MNCTDSLSKPRLSLPSLLTSSLWHTGNLLAFSHLDGPTDYAHGLVARTVSTGLDIQWPALCKIGFETVAEEALVTSDLFEIRMKNGALLRGVLLDAHHLLIEGSCIVQTSSPAISSTALDNRVLIGATTHFNPSLIHADFDQARTARLSWLNTLELPPSAEDLSLASQRSFARAISQMKGQVCSPEGIIKHPWTTPDRWPHRAMWLWDSAFHAIGWRHIDPLLAQAMIDAVLDAQGTDGFIAHMVDPHHRSEITQPPILAFAAKLILEKSHDERWLALIYPKLCAYVEWDASHRDTDGDGLVEWFIEDELDCRSGESGMDNSPRFDCALALAAPDFNAFLAGEYEVLAEFAQRLGKDHDAEQWSARHADLSRLINEKLWSTEHQLYCDRDPRSDTLTPVLSSAGFLPLICGAPSQAKARALATHLENPATFGTALPIPSIATCNQQYYSKDMWRGPVWININWFVARGLHRYGLDAEAKSLRTKTLHELERLTEIYGTFFEYIDDQGEVEPPLLLRKLKNIPGKHPHQAIHDYGWSATLYVDWLLETAE